MKMACKGVLVALLTSFVFTSVSFAESGKAIVPFWMKRGDDYSTAIQISNISSDDVEVSVKFYAQDGSSYDESSEGGANISHALAFYGQDTVSSTATLGAKETGQVALNQAGDDKRGFAIISWTSANDEPIALVASSRVVTLDGYGAPQGIGFTLINQGVPF